MEYETGTNNAGDELLSQALAAEVPADFGVLPEPEVQSAPPPVIRVADTPLPVEEWEDDALSLLAVFHAHSSLASAVILTEGHGAGRYRIGEALPGGGVLTAIFPGKVIIEDDERRLTLRMALINGALIQGDMAGTDSDQASEEREHDTRMSKEVLDALTKLDLHPVSEDSPQGYRVGDKFPESGTEELGVKPGDIIVAVNGYPVGEYTSDYLVWLSFKDTRKASVLVRNEEGKEFTFHYPDDVKGARLPGL